MKKNKIKKFFLSQFIAFILFLSCLYFFPHTWCERGAMDWYNNNPDLQKKLASSVEQWVKGELKSSDYATGDKLFSGEWLFGTYMMAAMGFGQMALSYPEMKDHYLSLMNKCIEKILSPAVKEYDRMSWGEDPVDSLDGPNDHIAYLGYFNLVLSFNHFIDPNSKYKELNKKITHKFVKNLEKSDNLLLYTYPNQIYLPDNCTVIGSIGLYDRATGEYHRELLGRWAKKCRHDYIDPNTGLLYQTYMPPGRGSGTAIGIYFLSFADKELSADLYKALKKELAGGLLGFGAIREYPVNVPGDGDIDSGPVVLGYGISATGFSLAGCRIHRDSKLFCELYGTSCLFGCPVIRGDRLDFVMGGPLGNAIMFAMITARPDISDR
ncbi:MAG: hypothetical protein ABRQ38_03660 [Candidatus Eremiobacterota bacterium]